jgi:nucleoside-diphosphate-sugar epimerase
MYAACKNAAREALQAYCERVGISFAWARFFSLYGPGEPKERLVPYVISALLRGETARCTSGEQIRDYLHVEDAASAVWAVARSNITGPVNIGSGQPVKVRTLVEILGRILDAGEKLALGALPTDPSDPPLLTADIRRLTTGTSWEPAVNLERGLHQTVAWWRKR